MAANEPFKSSTYQVGRIPKAFSDDQDGNLIFMDIPNPDGVTLTQLLQGIMGGNVKFDSSGSFYSGVTNVADALRFLNQFAYLKDTGRFVLVDSTVPNSQVVVGEIYNSLSAAVLWASGQTFNGYNYVNILLMGSHKQQAVVEASTDLGVYEIDYSASFGPIKLNKNGIKIIGIGNPVIRIKNFVGTAADRKWIFEVDTDGVNNDISIIVTDVGFEFVNSSFTSMFWVKNAPINSAVKERSGFSLLNSSVSFSGGTNAENRLVDVRYDTTNLVSNIIVDKLKLGSITNTAASSDPIQLIYLAHNDTTVVSIKDWTFGLAEQPNPEDNTDATQVTSFIGIVANSGRVVGDSIMLDEKFYWNGGLFSTVETRLLEAFGYSSVAMTNIGIIRHSFNPLAEDTGGITTIRDWISTAPTASVNIDGFDSYFNVDVQVVGASAVGTTGTTATSGVFGDVRPVKTFWNKDKLAFGIGHKGELRVGSMKSSDVIHFPQYKVDTYGIPLWYNSDIKAFQYWDGTLIVTIGGGGGGGGGKSYIKNISAPDFTPTSYTYPGETTFLGFETTFIHNLVLSNQFAYVITVVDAVTGRKIEPQEVLSLDLNTMKIILASPISVVVTLIGF